MARARVATEGAALFSRRLEQGGTLTFSTATGQLDFLLAPLPNGVAPARPFPPGATPWLANENLAVHPGGFQTLGPFPPMAQAMLDALVGVGTVSYAPACQADVELLVDQAAAGSSESILPITPQGSLTPGPQTAIAVRPPLCPWVLVLTTQSPEARGAFQVRGDVPGTAIAPTALWVRPTLSRFSFNEREKGGDTWDGFGGAPDPKFEIRALAGPWRLLLDTQADRFEGRPLVRGEPMEITATSPIELRITDVDVAVDDDMGTARVTIDDIRARGPELEVQVLLDGVETGTLWLRFETATPP
jgi:hypothetical protein